MRIAVYARVSTEHEAQINALENQLEWYKIECSRHSDWEIVEVYVDQSHDRQSLQDGAGSSIKEDV